MFLPDNLENDLDEELLNIEQVISQSISRDQIFYPDSLKLTSYNIYFHPDLVWRMQLTVKILVVCVWN